MAVAVSFTEIRVCWDQVPPINRNGEMYATLPDRHEMTALSDSTVVEGVALTTTANTAYGMMRHGERPEDEYEVMSSTPENPPQMYEVSSPPSSNQPLPTIPPPVATPTSGNVGEANQESVYEPIPGDK